MAKSPAPSTQTLGHYALRKKLGAGAMGQVWLAHDKLLDREVAIKILHAGISNKRLVQDFQREAQSAAKLNHPNTVTIYQIGKHGDQVYIAMEYVEAGSLSDELRDNGALQWREATQAIRDAAAGLQAAHERGMVHRDIKPSNLMRSARGLVKVVDFGLAKARTVDTEATQTQAGTILGSPAYMSPEQCRGERADARSDLYSLICSYFQLLTRRTPFAASEMTAAMYQHCHEPFPDARATGIKIPDGVCRILEKGSRKKPEERYQTAAELIADLDVVLHAPEVSHTFDGKGKDPLSKSKPERTGASTTFGSILRGKGVMGKTSWALVLGMLAWGFVAILGNRRTESGAGGQLAPIPSVADQYRAEREIKDIFKADYAKQKPSDRESLAQKLIDQGRDTNNDRAAKFVLFREARDVAAGTGDFELAFKAVDEMSAVFAVDATELKTTALVTAGPKADTDERNVAVTRACLALTDTAIAAEQYLVPARLLPIADAAAKKAQRVALHEDVQAKVRQVAELRADYDRRKVAAATLATSPNDPDANSAMGRSLCFMKGSWDVGLPMLVKGSETSLKKLAANELAAPATGPARLQLADAWWDMADRQGDLAKEQVQQHAVDWYARAWPQLAGIDRAKAESRMPFGMKEKLAAMPPTPAEIAKPVALNARRVVDVLKLIDVDRDQLAGNWKRKDGALASASRALIQIPYHPPAEYDFNVVFSPGNDAGHGMSLILSKGQRLFLFTISAEQYWDAFSLVKGRNGDKPDNPTKVLSAVRPALGQKYTIEVRVRNDHLEAFLSGRPVTSYKTDYSDLSNFSDFKNVQPGTLGLATWDAPATIYSAQVTEVTGSGTVGVGNHVVDLMPLIDVNKDAFGGHWKVDPSGLICDATPSASGRMRIGYDPPEEYALKVEFTRVSGNDAVVLILNHGRSFAWEMGTGKNTVDAFSIVDNLPDYHNSTAVHSLASLENGKRYKCVVLVRPHVVAAYLDGQTISRLETDYSNLSLGGARPGSGNALGIGCNGSTTIFHKIELEEITGTGKILPRDSAAVAGNTANTASILPMVRTDATGHRIIDLMPLIDPKADAIRGSWTIVGGKLRDDHNQKTLLRLPYLPGDSEEYDFHVGFVLRHGGEVVHGLATYAGTRFGVVADSAYGLENVGGKDGDAYHNSTTHNSTEYLTRDVQHDFVIRVRAAQVDVCLDGRRVINYSKGYDKLSENENWKRPDGALGIGAGWGNVDYAPIEVIEVKGTGTLLRTPIPTQAPATSSATGEDPHRKTPGLMRTFTTIGNLWSVQVAPGGRRLCFHTIHVFPHEANVVDVETGKKIRSSETDFVELLPDGKRFVIDSDRRWRICDIETGKDLFVLQPLTWSNAAISPDGSRMMTFAATPQDDPILYDLSTGAKICELQDHGTVNPRALTPRGYLFAAETTDDQLHVWDAEKGNELWRVAVNHGRGQLEFSADGKRLLRRSPNVGAPVDLFNAKTGELLAHCGGWSGRCNALAIRADGKFLVAGCDDSVNGLRLFKLEGDEKKLTATLMDWPAGAKEIGQVNSVAFSDDNRRVLVGCRNGKVRLYDVGQGNELAEFDHGGEVLQVSYALDNRYAVSGNDTSIRVWRLP